jgi:putative autotransporter adhesin-like protein
MKFKNLRQMIKVKGNGNIVSKEISVNSFIRLHIRVSAMVELIMADEEKVIVETDENLLEYMEIENSGRTLYVTTEGKWRIPDFTSLKIQVFYRQLYTLFNACEKGALVCANTLRSAEPLEIKIYSDKSSSKLDVEAPAIKLITACVGDVQIKGSCNLLEINAKSEGNLDAKNLKAKNVVLKNYSEGNIDLFADETLTISNYGEGNIHYWGNGILKDIKNYGEGEVSHQLVD